MHKKYISPIIYFFIGLSVILAFLFNKFGFMQNILLSLKFTLFIMLPGYVLSIAIFDDDFDEIALLFIGSGIGLILSTLIYYIASLFININNFTYFVPVIMIFFSIGIYIWKKNGKTKKSDN